MLKLFSQYTKSSAKRAVNKKLTDSTQPKIQFRGEDNQHRPAVSQTREKALNAQADNKSGHVITFICPLFFLSAFRFFLKDLSGFRK